MSAGRHSSSSDGGLRWTTSHPGATLVLDVRSNLAEGLGTGERPDADDRLGVGPEPVLHPPCGNSLWRAAQVLVDADAVPRIPSDKFGVRVPTPECRSTILQMHTIGSVKRDPRSYGPRAGVRRSVTRGGYRWRRHSLENEWIEGQSDDGSFRRRKHKPEPDCKNTGLRERPS